MPRTQRLGPILLAVLMVACTDAPAPAAPRGSAPEAVPPPTAPEIALPEELPADPVDAALSAAAGLPQQLVRPLADGVALGFEYGTLLDVSEDEGGGRQVLIEPIGLSMDEAVAKLARDLRTAGFEPMTADTDPPSAARQFRRHPTQGPDEVLSLEATTYPDPESAAHPGGTGVIALRLETRDGRG